jgi:murein DD-endopeptidase MepM/ murein hydrolase activator NlpD
LLKSLISAGSAVLDSTKRTVKHYPKRVLAIFAALLLAGAGGAFAVVSLAPDASELPVHQVLESVSTLTLNVPADLELQSFKLFRSEVSRSSDTTDTLLSRLGVDDAQAASFLRLDASARQALLGRSGRSVTVETSESNQLLKLVARWSPEDNGNFNRLVVERTANGFQSRIEVAALTASTRLASGTIQSSLFAATDEAKIPDSIATQLAEIFAGDIDFHRALRKGDRFSVVYETLEGDAEPLRPGRVLSAEFVNNNKTFQAMWFQDPASRGKGGYYTLDGQSLRRAYLASPMEFSRITSGFKMRFHPILQTMRAHQGVDYGAPTGTAVRSVGDGVVAFAGVQNGYGNMVILKHRNQDSTVYAHLSRINVRRGANVSQGQTIGAVGSTGWATGPHLHFEFRVNGVHRDPLTIARQSESVPVAASAKAGFARLASENRVALAAAAIVQQGSAQ